VKLLQASASDLKFGSAENFGAADTQGFCHSLPFQSLAFRHLDAIVQPDAPFAARKVGLQVVCCGD
jgi:hypothetical protein